MTRSAGKSKARAATAQTLRGEEKLTDAKIELIDEFKGQPSFKKMMDDGYHVLVF
ncbi:MAG TPA: hypothetical protein VK993_01170 [Chthoniobacterales bacterium]|nr:hypothetical protein [Chthoniobacterales bacterium]